MERLTERKELAGRNAAFVPGNSCFYSSRYRMFAGDAIERLAAIEDILGDEYDLDSLSELAEADMDGRCVVLNGKDKRNKTIRDLVKLLHWVCTSVRNHDFSPFRIVSGAPENTFPIVSKYDKLIDEHEDEIYTAFKDEELNNQGDNHK